jgi:predicted RNA-binding Zn ribbon-like protein
MKYITSQVHFTGKNRKQKRAVMTSSSKMGNDGASIEMLRLLGGRLCLDFTNTVDPRTGKAPHDFLVSYDDLVKWSRRVGALSESEAQHLLREAQLHPANAAMALERAIRLRELIYQVFSSIAHRTVPDAHDLAALKNIFLEAMTHAQIITTPDGFIWGWIKRGEAFDGMLWPVVRSAVDLLLSKDVKRVKQCPGLDDCGWLFLDTSKNGARQWCSMQGCGSRAKMRQYYARKHTGNKR